jgi:hypothetical protein
MRLRSAIPLSLAASCLWLASLGAAPGEDLAWPEAEDASASDCSETSETAARSGAFYTNFWPNGVVPYEFVTGSTDSIPVRNGRSWTAFLSDATFSVESDNTLRISSPSGLPGAWRNFDIVRCTGSNNNDGLDMTILSRGFTSGLFTSVEVEVPNGSTFQPEGPSPNVKFFATRSVSTQNQARFETSTERWEAVANINLRPRQSGDNDYIRVSNFNRNYVAGDVGHGSGARTLTMDAWSNPRTITHEIGHSLGLKHEHQRPDRDTYLNVNTNILSPNVAAGDFAIDNSITVYPDLFYDYGSIMHYSQNAGRAAGQTGTVFSIIDPDAAAVWQSAMGTVDSLSYWDKKTMSFMYPESNWRFLRYISTNPVQNGGFLTPWTVFDTAIAQTPTSGHLIIMSPHNFVEPGTYSKAVTIEAPQGGVTIRAN